MNLLQTNALPISITHYLSVEEDIKTKGPLKNKSITNYDAINFANTSQTPQGKDWNFKIASWNVDGIRAWLTKGGLDYIKHEKPDILCLQEVKCAKDKLPDDIVNLPGYHAYWLCSDKDGYAGVGIYTTKLAMNVTYGLQNEELDSEGRIITAEYEDFYLICTYVPNAGRKLVTLPKRLQWNEEFRKYVKELDEKKPVIICGDMNVAHNEIGKDYLFIQQISMRLIFNIKLIKRECMLSSNVPRFPNVEKLEMSPYLRIYYARTIL